MPGVPCVFYPHWQKYKEDLKPMIVARKWAGVHSESEVKDEYADGDGYQATVVGKYGHLILMLGNKVTKGQVDWLKGFELVASNYSTMEGHDESFEIWVSSSQPKPIITGIDEVGSEPQGVKAEKFMKDGKLFIRINENIYDITGKKIQ